MCTIWCGRWESVHCCNRTAEMWRGWGDWSGDWGVWQCSGREMMIGQEEGEYGSSGMQTMGMKVNFKICNRRRNRKGSDSVSIKRMFVHFNASCF